jgi:hypothetical protein
MPLLPNTLVDGFVRQFRVARVAGAQDAAQKFAQTYFDYAVTAASAYGPFIPNGTERPRLESMLAAAFSVPIGAAPVVAAAWGTGIQMFWVGAIFGAGAGSVVPGIAAIVGGLSAVLSNPLNTPESAAAAMASVIDTGTRTLLIAGPSGPVPVI